MLKFMGGGLIVLSCLGVYHGFKHFERQRITTLEAIILLIKYIRDRVDLYSMPIDKILDSCKDSILSQLGIEKPIKDLRELLSECEAVCDEESNRILRNFSDCFGKSYKEQQIKLCESTSEALNDQCRKLEKEFLARRKTVTALGVAIGGMIFIALL